MLEITSPSLPCCYFSTKTIIVDDEDVFLQALSQYMPTHNEQFNNSNEALQFLLNYRPQIKEDMWLEQDIETSHTDRISEQCLTVNLSKMKDIFSNNRRFDDISVLIIDCKMPNIDGLTILNQLKHQPFKKILLTGKGDHTSAIRAFNEGLIDYFLPKNEDNFLEKLEKIIEGQKKSYFFDLCRKIYDYSPHISKLSTSEEFKNYFLNIVNKFKISEFFLSDFLGNFVFLDNTGKKYFLTVRSHEQLDNLAKVAEEDGASNDTINNIRKHLKIPFFGQNVHYWQVPAHKWDSYLYTANSINSTAESCYAALISEIS